MGVLALFSGRGVALSTSSSTSWPDLVAQTGPLLHWVVPASSCQPPCFEHTRIALLQSTAMELPGEWRSKAIRFQGAASYFVAALTHAL